MDLFPIPELVAILLLFFYLFISFTPKNRFAPPQASGGWPIIGHFNLFRGSSQLPHIALGSMADKCGPIFTVRLGAHRALVVSSSEIAKEIFTTHDVAVSTRPKFLAAKLLGYNYAMFGLAPYGPYWREIRKIITLKLLSSRRLELSKHVRVSEVEAFVRELYMVWREKKDENGHVLVEMKEWFGDLSLNIVLRMVAGKRCGRGTDDSRVEQEMRCCREVMREFFHLLGVTVVADVLPFLGWLDLDGYEKTMKTTAKEMNRIFEGWLEEHRQMRDSGKVTDEQNFMDVMLTTTVQSGGHDGFDANEITKATCLVLIASSSDTTTSMLTWPLSLLLNNRDALRKAQEELDIYIGKDREVDESDINKLVYLQAIIKETLRLYPSAPLGGPREFSEDCVVAGYHVPKGTRLFVNLWKIHQDPQVWSEPLRFIPERFLTTSRKNIDVKGQDFELIPFGAGRRICPGMSYGLQMLHFVMATLLNKFDVSTPLNEPVDMTESIGLTNVKATPLPVLLTPRLSPDMY